MRTVEIEAGAARIEEAKAVAMRCGGVASVSVRLVPEWEPDRLELVDAVSGKREPVPAPGQLSIEDMLRD